MRAGNALFARGQCVGSALFELEHLATATSGNALFELTHLATAGGMLYSRADNTLFELAHLDTATSPLATLYSSWRTSPLRAGNALFAGGNRFAGGNNLFVLAHFATPTSCNALFEL